jgi:hypothetical protein
MSIKNSQDTIENRPHDLPVCSTVPLIILRDLQNLQNELKKSKKAALAWHRNEEKVTQLYFSI